MGHRSESGSFESLEGPPPLVLNWRRLREWREISANLPRPCFQPIRAGQARRPAYSNIDDLVTLPYGSSMLAGAFSPDPDVHLLGGFTVTGPISKLSSHGDVEVRMGNDRQFVNFVGSTQNAGTANAQILLQPTQGPLYANADLDLNTLDGRVAFGSSSAPVFGSVNLTMSKTPQADLMLGIESGPVAIAAIMSQPLNGGLPVSVQEVRGNATFDFALAFGRLIKEERRRFELSLQTYDSLQGFRGSVIVEQLVNGRLCSVGGDITFRRQGESDASPRRELRLGGHWHFSPKMALHLAGVHGSSLHVSAALVRTFNLRSFSVDATVSANVPVARLDAASAGISLVFIQ